ncbi:MAG: hypothetical protein II059_04220 [Clostridia bacterium]|nr:hypothetical protein [Clostridia bacterium]
MICPYNIQEETEVNHWEQIHNDEQTPIRGTTFTRTYYKYGKCKRKKCGAFHKGRCRYKPKD